MSTFRELATKLVTEARDDLSSRGEICDGHGVLVGAMVDAATIAVQDWLRSEISAREQQMTAGYEVVVALGDLIRQAGKAEVAS